MSRLRLAVTALKFHLLARANLLTGRSRDPGGVGTSGEGPQPSHSGAEEIK